MSDAVIAKTPPTKGYGFGPGSLEAITLTTWTNKHGIGKVRIAGWFMAYCGHGGEHPVRIDERGFAGDFEGWHTWQVALELCAVGLDGWVDPCWDEDLS
jgi:hypothetical protein